MLVHRRNLHTTRLLASGHNKWSKIRHSKGAIDSQRANLFSRLSQDLTLAAKLGGTDAEYNIRLSACIAQAKRADMPKSNIESAIKRATGKTSDGDLETLTYEATMGSIGLIIETLTDKKTRTIGNLKAMLKKYGASLSPCGFMFDRIGSIVVQTDKTLDEVMEIAIDIGASDVLELEGTFEIITEMTDLNAIAQKTKEHGLEILEAELKYRAKDSIRNSDQDWQDLVDLLDNDADVVRVTTNTVS